MFSFNSKNQINKGKREKRFAAESNIAETMWSNKELYTLTYSYSDKAKENEDYKERVEVFVENINQLGLIHMVHQPDPGMGSYDINCPIDPDYLMAKYRNPVIFDIYQSTSESVCKSTNFAPIYKLALSLFSEEKNGTVSLLPSGKISCNINHPIFQQYSTEIFAHELFHLFFLLHTHILEDTQGILNIDQQKPDFWSIAKGQYGKYLNTIITMRIFFSLNPYVTV